MVQTQHDLQLNIDKYHEKKPSDLAFVLCNLVKELVKSQDGRSGICGQVGEHPGGRNGCDRVLDAAAVLAQLCY